ncbi:MAG TPA: sigma-70 family RNA polymerase sigma factor [Cyclobacteriaceae bacterium]|nr:sigma-70 family RNA polymerase sigma factor [Cyclobacteriaceae bacterium]
MFVRPDESLSERLSKPVNVGSSVDEAILWENFKKGNELAFSIIYKRHIQRLYNYGMHTCKNKDLVLDCLQELFAKLWERRETVSSVGSVNFYLFKSFRRLLINKIVAGKKFSIPNPLAAQAYFEFIPSVEESLIEDELKVQQTDRLRASIKSLSKRQREALFLKFFNELSYHEVASIMDLRVDSVYNLISKAIDILRRKLKSTLPTLFCVAFCLLF